MIFFLFVCLNTQISVIIKARYIKFGMKIAYSNGQIMTRNALGKLNLAIEYVNFIRSYQFVVPAH